MNRELGERMPKSSHLLIIAFTLAMQCLLSERASAQYMFLDANGDSTFTAADSLRNGENHIGIWLITDTNRSGTPASCAGSNLAILSYEFILRASGAGIEWGQYQNSQSTMTVSFGAHSVGMDFYRGFGGSTSLSPGKYLLGLLTVDVFSPSVAIQVVPDSPLGGGLATSFGSNCPGQDGDNTLKLGTDWLDVDGLATSGFMAFGGASPVIAASGEGRIYLGGNLIPPPYELAFVGQDLTVNGLALPLQPAPYQAIALSAPEQEEAAFGERIVALADSLREAGLSVPDVAAWLESVCKASSIITTSSVRLPTVSWQFASGRRSGIKLRSDSPVGVVQNRERARLEKLEHFRSLLDMGSYIFIFGPGARLVIPSHLTAKADAVIQKLRSGEALPMEDGQRFPPLLQDQLRQPIRLVRSR